MNNLRYYFWYLLDLPLSYVFIDITFPVFATLILTVLIEKSFDIILSEHLIYYTLLGGLIIFFIILILQHRLIEKIFGKALKEFVQSAKGRHPVTKKFGAHLLRTLYIWKF